MTADLGKVVSREIYRSWTNVESDRLFPPVPFVFSLLTFNRQTWSHSPVASTVDVFRADSEHLNGSQCSGICIFLHNVGGWTVKGRSYMQIYTVNLLNITTKLGLPLPLQFKISVGGLST